MLVGVQEGGGGAGVCVGGGVMMYFLFLPINSKFSQRLQKCLSLFKDRHRCLVAVLVTWPYNQRICIQYC